MWWERLSKFSSRYDQRLKQLKFCISATSAFRHLTIVSSCANYKKGIFLSTQVGRMWRLSDHLHTVWHTVQTPRPLLMTIYKSGHFELEIGVECPKRFPSQNLQLKSLKRITRPQTFDLIGLIWWTQGLSRSPTCKRACSPYKDLQGLHPVLLSRLNVSSVPHKLWFLFCFRSRVLVCVQLSITCIEINA